MKNIVKMIAMIAAVFCVALAVPRSVCAADDTETKKHYFIMYIEGNYKYECFVEGSEVVAYYSVGCGYDYSKHAYEVQSAQEAPRFNFYRLNSSGTAVESVKARYSKRYVLTDGEWILEHDYSTDETPFPTILSMYSGGHNIYSGTTYDLSGSDIDLLAVDINERMVVPQKDGSKKYVLQNHDIKTNLYSYLIDGIFTDLGNHYAFTLHEDMESIVPIVQFSGSSWSVSSNLDAALSVTYDEENGIVSWKDFTVDKTRVKKKGVIAVFYTNAGGGNYFTYRTPLDGTSYSVSLGDTDLGNWTNGRYTRMMFIPYYLGTDHKFYIGSGSWIDIAEDSVVATRSASKMLTKIKSSTSSGGVLPDKAQGSGGSEPSDFQYDSSIPVPRLRFTGTLNFYIENASDDYFVEIQGRHYTVDDIELFKQNLLWKYKYSTVLKNDLSVWVDVQRRKLSRGNFDLLDLGSESFENLLFSYPIENRNYYGGSNALGNYLSGYSDALSQLKTVLLPVPGTLLNGTEIYIRFYTIDDQNICHYGKWCHWYDNMGDPDGSSASQWDDKENMFTENQSESGLTDSAKDQIEESGYSKSDSDVSSSYNNTSSWDSKASDSVFAVISSIVSSLGAFPNLIAKVCSFLPDWALILIGVGIGFVVLLRFVGR